MKTYKSARHVKQALLNGEEVVINRWAALINRQDEVEIWDPKGKGVVASMLHLDKAVKDFYRLAQGIPEKMPKPVTYEKTPSGSGPLGDDTSGDKPWTDPKVNKRPVMQGPTSDPNLKDDTSQDPPWTDPAVNTRPMPDKGRGGLPDTDLGKDTQKNDVEWEDKLTGPEVFRMARDKKMKARKKRAEEGEFLGNIGDMDWLAYGGTLVFRNGDYLEATHVDPWMIDAGEVEDEYDPNMRWEVYSWPMDKFQIKDGKLVNEYGREDWFTGEKALNNIANSIGMDVEELKQAFTSDNPLELASAYDAVAGYYGYHELDSYSQMLTREEMKNRFEKITGEEIDLPEDEEEDEEDFDIEASRRRRSQDMDPGDSGKEEMGTSDPDNEFYPEIEYEPHQIENKGEAPSDLPNDLGGRNNARRRAQQSAVGDFIWEKLSIFDEWWETDAGSHYWRDFKNNVNAWIDTIEEAVQYAEESGSGDVSQVDAPAYIGELASILFKLGPEGVTRRAFQVQLEDIQNEAIDFAFENMTTASRRGFVDTFDREARPQASYQDMVNASPSRDLLENIADPERWAATQAVKAFSSGYGRGLYKDMDGKRDKANKGMDNMQGKDPDEVEAGCDYPEKKKKSRRQAGPRLKENWTTDGGYSRDIEAESPEELYHLTKSFGSDEDYDWSSVRPQQQVAEDEAAMPIEARKKAQEGDVHYTEEGDAIDRYQYNSTVYALNAKEEVVGILTVSQFENPYNDGITEYTVERFEMDPEHDTPEIINGMLDYMDEQVGFPRAEVEPQLEGSRWASRKALDDNGKSYWRDYFGDYGEDLVKDDSTKKNRKELEPKVDETPKPAGQQKVKSRRRTRGQAMPQAPAAPPESAPPGGQMSDPETAPQTPAQSPAPPAKPEKAPGAGDEGLKALGWTPEEIKLMNDEDKQKILQVQLKKPGTGAAQAPAGQPAQKPPAKPAPAAPQAGPAPMPAAPEQGMPAPTARRLKRESAEKQKIARAFQRLAQAAPVQTEQMPPVPQTSPSQPVQPTNQTAPTPAAPGEPAVADEFAGDVSLDVTPETEAMSIYNEILQKEVKAASPEQVPALKSQEFIKRLVTQVGMPITEARQLFGLKSGDGFNKLFQ